MGWEDLRSWVLPGLAIVSLVWQAASSVLRKNFARIEDFHGLAKTEDLLGANKVLQDQQTESDKEIVRAHHRIDMVELRLKQLPDFDTVNELRKAVSTLTGEVRALGVEVKAVDDKIDTQGVTVSHIHEHLLNQSKPR